MDEGCARRVREADPDRFLLSLFMPETARPALWALYAFNYEIARTREVVSDPNLGYIRLQWWRDALGDIYAGKERKDSDALEALGRAIRDYDLPRQDFEGLLVAREKDLDTKGVEDKAQLLEYAATTTAPLTHLAATVSNEVISQENLLSISSAYSLCGLMRAAYFHAGQGRTMVPGFVAGQDNRALFKDIRALAEEKNATDAGDSRSLQKMQRMTGLYLKHMRKLDDDARDNRFTLRPPFFVLKLMVG